MYLPDALALSMAWLNFPEYSNLTNVDDFFIDGFLVEDFVVDFFVVGLLYALCVGLLHDTSVAAASKMKMSCFINCIEFDL